MDNLKILVKNEKELKSLVETSIKIYERNL